MDTVHFVTSEKGIKEAPTKYRQYCRRATQKLGEKTKQNAKKEAPVETGRLSGKRGGEGGIHYRTESRGNQIHLIVSATALNPATGDDYSGFVEKGTGVYGPKGRRITPKKGKFLVFMKDNLPRPRSAAGWRSASKAGNVIYARSVKGRKPDPFMERSLKSAVTKNAKAIFTREMDAFNKSV